jgi:hypothetical protein
VVAVLLVVVGPVITGWGVVVAVLLVVVGPVITGWGVVVAVLLVVVGPVITGWGVVVAVLLVVVGRPYTNLIYGKISTRIQTVLKTVPFANKPTKGRKQIRITYLEAGLYCTKHDRHMAHKIKRVINSKSVTHLG